MYHYNFNRIIDDVLCCMNNLEPTYRPPIALPQCSSCVMGIKIREKDFLLSPPDCRCSCSRGPPSRTPRRVHRRRNVGRRPRNILGKKPNMICIKERLDIIKQISTRIDLAASRAILIYFPTRLRPSYELLKSRPLAVTWSKRPVYELHLQGYSKSSKKAAKRPLKVCPLPQPPA